jgi:hypothetical protein
MKQQVNSKRKPTLPLQSFRLRHFKAVHIIEGEARGALSRKLRRTGMNPLSHATPATETRAEIREAIEAVKALKLDP